MLGFVVLGSATPAAADAAGPTTYQSRVISITPPTSAIRARIVGGDSFIDVTVTRGHRLIVIGYRGEQYLRYEPNGDVLENQSSPTTYLNKNRFGDVTVPPNATPQATPRWKQVASGGDWAWHDHRTHWMDPQPPLDRHPGQRILDATVPLRLDGHTESIRVISTWLPRPSLWPSIAGAAVAAVAATAGLLALRTQRAAAVLLVVAGATALLFGAWEFFSLPGATGPNPVWFLLPALTVVAATWALRNEREVRQTATMVAAASLLVWAIMRSPGMWRAVLPTSAPFWLDRASTAAAIVTGALVAAIGLTQLAIALAAPGVAIRRNGRPPSGPTDQEDDRSDSM